MESTGPRDGAGPAAGERNGAGAARGAVLLDAAVTTRCRRRVHLEHDPDAGRAAGATGIEGADQVVLPEPDPGVEMRVADAAEHRAQLAARFAAGLGAAYRPVPDGRRGERVEATLAVAADPEVWAIGAAELPPGDGRRGHAELLVRAGDDGGWYPVIVVRHRVTDPGTGALTSPLGRPHPSSASPDPQRKVRAVARDLLRLAHLHRMLAAAGLGARAAWGGVVGLDADCVVWTDLAVAPGNEAGRSPLDTYDRRFADRLAVARAARDGGPALAQPSRITECRRCPWWPVCEAELRRVDDVSLVVRGEDALRLRGRGITTVRTLAALDPRQGLPEPAGAAAADPAAGELGADLREAVALARAWRADVPLVRRVRRPEVPRGAVEVDVDMESLGEDGAYLWGVLLSGADVGLEHGYRGFATWDPVPTRDEARSFAAFWAWLTDVRRRAEDRGLSFRSYCYNEQAENRWLRGSVERFAGEPGMPAAEDVERFIASDEWIDLFPAVSTSFLCPHGKGLKRVAPSAGFAWRDPEAGGENSMRWYRRAVGLDGEEPEPAMRDRLLVYNEDDVRATHALRTWMTSDAVLAVPHLDDLRPDPEEPGSELSGAACAGNRRTG
ncbi:TM0106 family RecB-like putative nuclease [Actinomycetospora termitidis]|uniref:TM0106 family RecB-like putative nuclease n=1 Tax=Actinomycetospora termitidis TaxID=3053470 RepID=A0ABT7M4R1_9PSEU|nr:TM0106 family RecB-like putative nuclease [Actinomycetospora sp. Odt1-22]MDL5154757.1 TM0106 family RecB-like putative nuclease [Actinomycetospora sp. Odt1-22]